MPKHITYKNRVQRLQKSLRLSCLASMVVAALIQPAFADELSQKLEIQNNNVSAQIESVDSVQAEQDKLKTIIENAPPAYQDKVMSAPELLELTTQEAEEVPEGFQSFFFETRVDYADAKTNQAARRQTGAMGIRGEYLYETQNYGDLKMQVQGSQQADNAKDYNAFQFENDQPDTSVTLINNNLSVTPTIAADSALGDVASEVTDVLRRSSRFSLGVDTVRGARTRLHNDSFDIRLGSGELGELKGSPYSGYKKTDGRLSWIGASHAVGKTVVIGLQANQVKNFKQLAPDQTELNAVVAALNYDSDDEHDKHLRLTVLKSQKITASKKVDSQGIQLEGGFQLGRYTHEFGAYKSDPDLYFGENLLASDQQGVYWRTQRQSARLNWGLDLALEEDNLQKQTAGNSSWVNLDGNFQYRYDHDHSYGGSLRLEQISYDAVNKNDRRSAYGYFYYQLLNADWGRSRFSATFQRNETVVSNDVAATGDQFEWEQDWLGNADKVLNAQPELVTTVGFAQDRSNSEKQTYPTAGINARYWPNPDWSLNSSLHYSSRSGKLSNSQGLSGSVTSEYKLAQTIRLGASINLNQAKIEVDSYGVNEAKTLRSNDKSAQVYLRWEGSRGREHNIIGQRTEGLAGTGSTVGYVFSDTNQDGERQADELGVPDVEIYLDGGFSVRTDKYGYFEFTRVATGSHQLTLNLDTVPLPWGTKEAGLSVDVPLRGQVTANLALTKSAD